MHAFRTTPGAPEGPVVARSRPVVAHAQRCSACKMKHTSDAVALRRRRKPIPLFSVALRERGAPELSDADNCERRLSPRRGAGAAGHGARCAAAQLRHVSIYAPLAALSLVHASICTHARRRHRVAPPQTCAHSLLVRRERARAARRVLATARSRHAGPVAALPPDRLQHRDHTRCPRPAAALCVTGGRRQGALVRRGPHCGAAAAARRVLGACCVFTAACGLLAGTREAAVRWWTLVHCVAPTGALAGKSVSYAGWQAPRPQGPAIPPPHAPRRPRAASH
jgi:hypothetical protein